jgi:predicted TPR repeat methyltransferase
MTASAGRASDKAIALAFELYDREDPAAALALEAVLAADPDHVAARYKLANLQKEAGDLDLALANYARVLQRSPGHAEALNNLGAVRQARGELAAAEACYRESIEHAPLLVAPALNLARLLQELGRSEEAARVCAAAEARGLDAGLFGHLRSALGGGAAQEQPAGSLRPTAGRAPDSYVRETFDAFAAGFEQRLVDELEYRVPQMLAALVIRADRAPPVEVLDLGCGTGLVADALAGLVENSTMRLTGVDLSSRMLDEARRKGRYAALHEGDVTGWLVAAPAASFDLVMAADVFIYIGELDAVFAAVARTLRPGGRFAFSVETCADGDWQLRSSGRYAQSDTYIRSLARSAGLAIDARKAVMVRRGVEGALFVLAVP